MISPLKNRISLVVGGVQLRNWTSYRIETSLTNGVGTFELRMPFDGEAWELTQPPVLVQVLVDDTAVITGFVEDSDSPDDDANVLVVTGRDKCAWLQLDCPPGIDFGGLGMKELITKLAQPFLSKVSFDNSRNRTLVRGRGGKKARAGSEPLSINSPKKVGTRIEPGQTRLNVIAQLCQQAGLLFWSSGDGKELLVGKPNYDQEPQYRLFSPAPGSRRLSEATVLGRAIHRSAADRYSRVICVGSGAGTDSNYGPGNSSRYGQALDNPEEPDGTGHDFPIPKTLIVQRKVSSAAEATQFAEDEMARRDAKGLLVTARAGSHGQLIAGVKRTLFAPDTIAIFEDERTGIIGPYLLVSTTFTSGRQGGEETTMQLVPKGTKLTR